MFSYVFTFRIHRFSLYNTPNTTRQGNPVMRKSFISAFGELQQRKFISICKYKQSHFDKLNAGRGVPHSTTILSNLPELRKRNA